MHQVYIKVITASWNQAEFNLSLFTVPKRDKNEEKITIFGQGNTKIGRHVSCSK